jgi:hypothetical protein
VNLNTNRPILSTLSKNFFRGPTALAQSRGRQVAFVCEVRGISADFTRSFFPTAA